MSLKPNASHGQPWVMKIFECLKHVMTYEKFSHLLRDILMKFPTLKILSNRSYHADFPDSVTDLHGLVTVRF